MKKTQFIALILLLAICVSAFAGCGGKTPEENTTASKSNQGEETTEGVTESKELHPDIAMKDYGENFYYTIMTHVNEPSYYWVEEPQNNALSDAIYARQIKIKDYLGVEMFGTAESEPGAYISNFQTAVKNQDDSVHMLITHCFTGLDGFITGNYFLDYNDADHINLDEDYWALDVMENVALKDHMYLGFSDFNIVRTNVVLFNKELYSQYEDAIVEDFYTLVEDYKWTLDKMMSISSLIYADALADGKTKDDTFGISGDYEVPYASLVQASNINIVEMDETGNYAISLYNEKNKKKMSDLVDKLSAFVASDYAYFDEDPSFATPCEVFSEGRALMYLSRTTSLEGIIRDDVSFGVLPYPMYDEAQKSVGYRSLQWGGFLALPSYMKNPDMVFETMELISYFSEDVNIAYYEKLLGKKVADAPKDRVMLDIVWDSVCSDFGLTYSSVMNAPLQWVLSSVTKPNGTMGLSSYMAQYEGKASKTLKKFMERIK